MVSLFGATASSLYTFHACSCGSNCCSTMGCVAILPEKMTPTADNDSSSPSFVISIIYPTSTAAAAAAAKDDTRHRHSNKEGTTTKAEDVATKTIRNMVSARQSCGAKFRCRFAALHSSSSREAQQLNCYELLAVSRTSQELCPNICS